ncbi:MAG: PCRF domain-containing protein, partial [Candidatus Neomarinimicrobiota bacterium]
MLNAEQIREDYENVLQKYEEVASYMNLEEKETRIRELREKTLEADFWQNKQRAQEVSKTIADLEFEIERWKKLDMLKQDIELQWMLLEEDSGDLKELSGMVESLSRRILDLETEKLLSGKHDRSSAILIIHPGAGGTESHDWASILYRMYVRWIER